jgi:hypothetical protein
LKLARIAPRWLHREAVDGVSYTYYPLRRTGMLTFPDGMLSAAAASIRLHNFRVTAEFGDDVEAAIRAKIAVIIKLWDVEEAPQPARSTDAPSSASIAAERPQRRRAPVNQLDPSVAWSAYDRDQSGQRHYAVTPRGDFSKANREELNAMHERVVTYQAALQTFIDQHYSSADQSSANDDDAMEMDLFEGAEPRATLRPTSATPTVGVGEPECIAALQNAMIDLLHEEDLALDNEPTLFEQVMTQTMDYDSSDDEGEGEGEGGAGGQAKPRPAAAAAGNDSDSEED